MRRFNTVGLCVPSEDYMVDISQKLNEIIKLIGNRYYFSINRARQYGKTTTLSQLQKRLAQDYICARISFEGIGDEEFKTTAAFCQMFIKKVSKSLEFSSAAKEYSKEWLREDISSFHRLSDHITKMCEDRKIVLLIDETDKAGNNRIFLHFLGMLRDKYLLRKDNMDHTFHSVILAGVVDIKNIKIKMITEGSYSPSATESKMYNSPWNIAADFNIDMSFKPVEIASMLIDYEADHHMGMSIVEISEEIYGFTRGYPFLVSRICKCIDEELNKNWTIKGVRFAVKALLTEHNTLFDDIYKNLEANHKLYSLLYDLIISGIDYTFNFGNPEISLGVTYGLLTRTDNNLTVNNKIFETLISNYFISKNETASHQNKITGVLREDIIVQSRFDMELCLKKFAMHYAEIYSDSNDKFFEKHGRLLFLTYLRPLINGSGFYHIESETRNQRRMDLVVDYGTDEFIIELKLWRGEVYEATAYKQLLEYMNARNSDIGYLLTFDFRTEKNKSSKAEWIEIEGKRIFCVIV